MRPTPFRILTIAAGFGLAGGLASPIAARRPQARCCWSRALPKLQGASERTLQKGDEVEVGDVVSTDSGGRLQILMADGGRIVLQPGSSVRIDEFAMPSAVVDPNHAGGGSSAGKSVATLLSGRIDASAGAIGAITIHTHGDPVTLTRGRSSFVSLDAAGGLSAPPALVDAGTAARAPNGRSHAPGSRGEPARREPSAASADKRCDSCSVRKPARVRCERHRAQRTRSFSTTAAALCSSTR